MTMASGITPTKMVFSVMNERLFAARREDNTLWFWSRAVSGKKELEIVHLSAGPVVFSQLISANGLTLDEPAPTLS